jgi:uncharacterized protein YdiU (UPF0061 family)
MGTRSGDLDPGVLVYLMREKKFDAAMLIAKWLLVGFIHGVINRRCNSLRGNSKSHGGKRLILSFWRRPE